MRTSLAGNNVLVIERSKVESKVLVEALSKTGANVFVATDIFQALGLQHRWDIDIVLCEVSFLTGMSDVIAHLPHNGLGKSTPLLFVYGTQLSVHPQTFVSRGGLKFFSTPLNYEEVCKSIAGHLYDPKLHIEQLSEESQPSQFMFILQNGQDAKNIEVTEFSDDGLTCFLDSQHWHGEVASLTVLVPNKTPCRFAVRIERRGSDTTQLKVKVLMRDRERWLALMDLIDNRQQEITEFLFASSGK